MNIEAAAEIINSNQEYNYLENGSFTRTLDEVRKELMNDTTESYLIKRDHQWVGVIDYLKYNHKDQTPWLGLLMIKGSDHYKGYGKRAYNVFEEKLRNERIGKIRLGVLQTNEEAKVFWGKMGFIRYGTSQWEGKAVDCYEKILE